MKNLLSLALMAILLLLPLPARAQETAADYLPVAESIGEGWVLIEQRGAIGEIDPSFADMARGVYTGPNGARVAVNVYLVADGTAAIRQSWEVITESYDSAKYSFDFDFSSEQQADDTPLPEGCVDGRRSSGGDKVFGGDFMTGFAICAADPNVILWVTTSGEIDGLSGIAAADAFTSIVLNGAGTPTP